jgi:hypothetical protein
MDTSFKALFPYVHSIPLAVHANESFPLALIVGLSESIEFYTMFFDAMASIGITQDQLQTKPFLTDQHKALKHVCADYIHFYCLRHLIENFGSNSFLGQIVRRLSFSSTPEAFNYNAEISIRDIQALHNEIPLDEKKVHRLIKWFGIGDSKSNWNFSIETWANQSIWNRANYGVSTCSNHAEGLHRAINNKIKLERELRKRFNILVQCMLDRFNSGSLYKHEQGTRLLTKLQR